MNLYAKLLLLGSICVAFIAVRWSAPAFNKGELNDLSVYLHAVIKFNIRITCIPHKKHVQDS